MRPLILLWCCSIVWIEAATIIPFKSGKSNNDKQPLRGEPKLPPMPPARESVPSSASLSNAKPMELTKTGGLKVEEHMSSSSGTGKPSSVGDSMAKPTTTAESTRPRPNVIISNPEPVKSIVEPGPPIPTGSVKSSSEPSAPLGPSRPIETIPKSEPLPSVPLHTNPNDNRRNLNSIDPRHMPDSSVKQRGKMTKAEKEQLYRELVGEGRDLDRKELTPDLDRKESMPDLDRGHSMPNSRTRTSNIPDHSHPVHPPVQLPELHDMTTPTKNIRATINADIPWVIQVLFLVLVVLAVLVLWWTCNQYCRHVCTYNRKRKCIRCLCCPIRCCCECLCGAIMGAPPPEHVPAQPIPRRVAQYYTKDKDHESDTDGYN